MAERDYYMILGVPRRASAEQIKQAFRGLAMRHHPDRAGRDATGCFQEIAEAYAVLTDEQARARYDLALARGTARPPRPCRGHGRHRRKPPAPESLFADAPPASSWGRTAAPEVVTLQVRLSPAEALLGARVLVPLPVQVLCPACGVGPPPLLGCRWCGGSGHRRIQRELALDLPAGLSDGSVLELPLAGPGLERLSVQLRVSVTPSRW